MTDSHEPKEIVHGLTETVELKDWELSYAAGIIDGEGSIWIGHCSPTHYQLCVRVMMKHPDIIIWLSFRFGGTIRSVDKLTGRYYEWYLQGPNVVSFLKKVELYIILKKKQVKVAEEFQSLMTKRGGRKRQTEEARRKKHELYILMHHTNDAPRGKNWGGGLENLLTHEKELHQY